MALVHSPFGKAAISAITARLDATMIWSASSVRSVSLNSAIISDSRFAPTSLQAASENTSPSVSTGVRVLARIIAIRVWFIWPRSTSFSIGIDRPSMKTSVASGPKPMPPMSIRWLVQENSATSFPSWKAGVVTTKSFRCPVPIQGSLVM
jgi:hypothetical protein